MSSIDLSIITVTWNSEELIGEQLRSAKLGCKDITCEHIVVDNASRDNTVDYIQKEFPDVTVIANDVGKGFGAANRQGVEVSTGEYLLFLNPDMRIESESLDKMMTWFKANPDIGLACPKLVDEHGNINWNATPRRFPKLWEQLALILKLPHLFPHMLDSYMMKGFDPEVEQDVDSLRGSFLLMRRELRDKLGWSWDPRYFIWYEDVDICREAKRLNYRVVYTPIISAVDYVGQSFKKRTTLWKQKQFTKSMLTYFQKWEPWYKWMWIALFRPVGIAMAWMNDALHRR